MLSAINSGGDVAVFLPITCKRKCSFLRESAEVESENLEPALFLKNVQKHSNAQNSNAQLSNINFKWNLYGLKL